MKKIYKVGFIISWPREIDFFKNLLPILDGKYDIIVDDVNYSDKERVKNFENIKSALFNEKIKNYYRITEILDTK